MAKNVARPKNIRFAVIATDIVVFRIVAGELCVLLGKVNTSPYFINRWGVIGGLVLPKETVEKSAERLLQTKAGIGSMYKEQLYTFSSVDRDPRGRVVSVAHLGLAKESLRAGEGSMDIRWVSLRALPDLAYDHNEMVAMGLERLRARIGYTNIVQHLLPETFTLSELQALYEKVLNRKLDKRNFRKKVLKTRMIRKSGIMKKEGAMRPAALYEFASKAVKTVQIL